MQCCFTNLTMCHTWLLGAIHMSALQAKNCNHALFSCTCLLSHYAFLCVALLLVIGDGGNPASALQDCIARVPILALLQMADLELESVVWEEDRSNLDVVIGLAQRATDPGVALCSVWEPRPHIEGKQRHSVELHSGVGSLAALHGRVIKRLPISPACATGVPERLFQLLSEPHTLVHALHLGYKQLRVLESQLGKSPSSTSYAADRVLELLATTG
jgi:hypothetical protein